LDGSGEGEAPAGHKAKAVTRLKNGGILMELGCNKAVAWFQNPSIQKKFLAGLHPDVCIKSRNYHIVVQFVLLIFKPDKVADIKEIEGTNNMERGTITWAQWISRQPGGPLHRPAGMQYSHSPHWSQQMKC